MTFSLAARDSTGALGMVVTSSSPCVAARCLHVRSNIGVVASQNITDPRFGDFLLNRLEAGDTAQQALAALKESDTTLEYRQISIVPAAGPTAAHSGSGTLGTYSTSRGDGVVAAGNLLSDPSVPDAMRQAFETTAGDLEYRLLAAVEAGAEAGGEEGDVHSVGLAVTRDVGWKVTDLRIDWSEDPIGDLRELLRIWMDQRDDYVTRGLNPGAAPSYGVPGDE